MFWVLGFFVSLFILYSDYAHYFYSRRRGLSLQGHKAVSLVITVTLPMVAVTQILNDLDVSGYLCQVSVVLTSALVGGLVCLSERYRFKVEKN